MSTANCAVLHGFVVAVSMLSEKDATYIQSVLTSESICGKCQWNVVHPKSIDWMSKKLVANINTTDALRSDRHSAEQNTPYIYGTRWFMIIIIKACHRTLPWTSSMQLTYTQPISLRPILIISSHLRVSVPSDIPHPKKWCMNLFS
jgi:hypothetical protein